jgi:hypothetical protein
MAELPHKADTIPAGRKASPVPISALSMCGNVREQIVAVAKTLMRKRLGRMMARSGLRMMPLRHTFSAEDQLHAVLLLLTTHTVDLDYLYQPVKDRRADT